MECLRLRIKDIDFGYHCIHVHNGKGAKDRIVTLPAQLEQPISNHLHNIHLIHDADLESGFGEVYLPSALARKYPKAAQEWKWLYVFAASKTSSDPRSKRAGPSH
jgi:integrase